MNKLNPNIVIPIIIGIMTMLTVFLILGLGESPKSKNSNENTVVLEDTIQSDTIPFYKEDTLVSNTSYENYTYQEPDGTLVSDIQPKIIYKTITDTSRIIYLENLVVDFSTITLRLSSHLLHQYSDSTGYNMIKKHKLIKL